MHIIIQSYIITVIYLRIQSYYHTYIITLYIYIYYTILYGYPHHQLNVLASNLLIHGLSEDGCPVTLDPAPPTRDF